LIINGLGEDEDAASSSEDLRRTLDWEWWEAAKVSGKPQECRAREVQLNEIGREKRCWPELIYQRSKKMRQHQTS